VQAWNEIAPWLVEALFVDDVYRRAFAAIAESAGSLNAALELADPEARDVLERAAVVDLVVDVEGEARNLIGAAVRRELSIGRKSADNEQIRSDAEARVKLEQLLNAERGLDTAGWLLGWLEARMEGRTGGV
jgi:DNA primase